jgi:hypothetical protein
MTKDDYIFDFDLEESQESSLRMVLEHFNGDEEKAKIWFEVANPLLGGIKPYIMLVTRPERLERFLKDMRAGNQA